MTVKCSCDYEPKDFPDLMRHVTLMSKRGSKENHGADVSEWDVELCKVCHNPINEAVSYDNLDEVIICKGCGNSRPKTESNKWSGGKNHE